MAPAEAAGAAVSAVRDAVLVFDARDKRLLEGADAALAEAKDKMLQAASLNRSAGDPDDRATRVLRRAQELVEESKSQRVSDPTGRFPGTAAPALEAAVAALDAVQVCL